MSAPSMTETNLAAMLRRMIWQINKQTGDSSLKVLAGRASALLERYGLQGSPLRDAAHRVLAASDAEGRLIDAAPDLLAALKAMIVMSDRGPQPRKLDEALTWRENDELARSMANAAIAKATGPSAGTVPR